jgi:hypothetical protein
MLHVIPVGGQREVEQLLNRRVVFHGHNARSGAGVAGGAVIRFPLVIRKTDNPCFVLPHMHRRCLLLALGRLQRLRCCLGRVTVIPAKRGAWTGWYCQVVDQPDELGEICAIRGA